MTDRPDHDGPGLEALLPHRRPMLHLDRLLAGDGRFARAALAIDAGKPLVVPGRGLPTWALVEVFAQTAALIGGLRAREAGEAVAQGFLLGTRRLDCPVAWVPEGMTLEIEARTEFVSDGGMGAYHCRTLNLDPAVACVLSVYTPEQEPPPP